MFEANKNNLSTLPSAVKHLHQLTRMSLTNNRLNKLPQVLGVADPPSPPPRAPPARARAHAHTQLIKHRRYFALRARSRVGRNPYRVLGITVFYKIASLCCSSG